MTARYWHLTDDGRVRCDLCPRECTLRDGQRGFCFVRQNIGGRLELTTYGRSSGFCVDPIEKKPLNHVSAGQAVLSFGTAGCNLGCRFCQNWELSTAHESDILSVTATGEQIAEAAVVSGCRGVAYTYNDPVIFAEYAIDVAAACHERGLLNVAVTAGYLNAEPRADFFAWMDAANVDLKSFDPAFYRKVVGGHLETVQETLRCLVHETQVWVEVTTLVIPGLNDSDAELSTLAEWIAGELGPSVPWHVTAFHPDNKMRDVPPTSRAALTRARRLGQDAGLRFVYTGNVRDLDGATTFCPSCGRAVVVRNGYAVTTYALGPDGSCRHCGEAVPGRWDAAAGTWGNARRRVGIGTRPSAHVPPARPFTYGLAPHGPPERGGNP